MKKIYYLKPKGGEYVTAKFVLPNKNIFDGEAYEAVAWDSDENVIEWCFHSSVYAKWDGCSHWYFFGEDYDKSNPESMGSYYHICSSFQTFIAIMCFIWKIAGDYHIKDLKSRNITTEYTTEEYKLKLIDYVLKDYEIFEENE